MEGQLGERSGVGGNHLVWTGDVMRRRLQFEVLGQLQSERQAEEKSVFEYSWRGAEPENDDHRFKEETETNIRSFSSSLPIISQCEEPGCTSHTANILITL